MTPMGNGNLAAAGLAGVRAATASRFGNASGAPFSESVSDRPAPDRPFPANLRRLAEDRRNSLYLDSRIERWCYHCNQDAGLSRTALEAGYTLRFTTLRRGHSILLHIVRPEEIR